MQPNYSYDLVELNKRAASNIFSVNVHFARRSFTEKLKKQTRRRDGCPGIKAGWLSLRTRHVWLIQTKLQIEGRTPDLAMLNLAIDRKLRGRDVAAIRVEDVAASGYTADRATVQQRKNGQPVRFELSEQTRQAIDGSAGAQR
jgi:hypothetical protein